MTKRAKAQLAAQAKAVSASPPDDATETSAAALAATAGTLSPSGPQHLPEPIKTMSVPDAGRLYFGLSRNGSYEAARRGDLPVIRVGRLLKVVPSVLERRLAAVGQPPAIRDAQSEAQS
jgi:hypothetical protein